MHRDLRICSPPHKLFLPLRPNLAYARRIEHRSLVLETKVIPLYEAYISSTILSPQAGAVEPLQWLHCRFSTCLLKSDTEVSVVAHVGYPSESQNLWCRRVDSNYRPLPYEDSALTTVLLRQMSWHQCWDECYQAYSCNDG